MIKYKKKSPTIIDVAKLAGVSVSTVSRVINNSSRISTKTSKKVMEVIQKLKYKPNNIARRLSSKKTNTIGVIL